MRIIAQRPAVSQRNTVRSALCRRHVQSGGGDNHTMKISVLGCNGGVGPGLRTTAFLVDDHVLLDAGTGVCDLPPSAMQAISHIFFSHAHLDHVAGAALLMDVIYDSHAGGVNLHGTEATLSVLREHLFNWKLWPDFSQLPTAQNPTMRYRAVEAGQPVVVDGLRITAVPVAHSVPTVGYIIEDDAGTVAFSGDTATNDTLWTALNALDRLDRLIVEVSFPADHDELGEVTHHYTTASLPKDLEKLRHRPELLITHNKPGFEAQIQTELPRKLPGWSVRFLQRGDLIEV